MTSTHNRIVVNLHFGTWRGEDICCVLHSSLLNCSVAFRRPSGGGRLQSGNTDPQIAPQIRGIFTDGVILDVRRRWNGTEIGKPTHVRREKSVLLPLCPPQMPRFFTQVEPVH
jgi:hypothetical protein